MTAKKIKSAQDGWKQQFELVSVDMGGMSGTTSLVATSCGEKAKEKDGWPPKDVCRKILSEIGNAWKSGKPWSSFPQTKLKGRYAPDLIKARFGVPPEVGLMMIETWLKTGDPTVLSYGTVNKSTKMQGLEVTGSID
jgi:hypothetical protein